MVFLAYDGSLNGDWVARYAILFAARSEGRSLTLLHVNDGSLGPEQRDAKLDGIERLCREQKVSLTLCMLALHERVDFSLLKVLPNGPGDLLVCGTRVRQQTRGYLAGTVAERLLAASHIPVLALRVVQPGLLGQPRSLLLPFGGHPRGCRDLAPLLSPLLPGFEVVHLLRAIAASPGQLLRLSSAERLRLRQAGLRYLRHVHAELDLLAGDRVPRIDEHLAICDDWVNEILMLASRLRIQLMIIGATSQPRWRHWLRPAGIERLLAATPCDVGIYRGP